MQFVPAVQETELRGEAEDVQARVAVAWRGIVERDEGHELRFRIRIDNPEPTPFALVPAEFELLDAGLAAFGAARAESLPVLVEPGGSALFELAFPAPEIEAFDLSTLTLRLRFQAGRWSWSTQFQRAYYAFHDPYYEPWRVHLGVVWCFD